MQRTRSSLVCNEAKPLASSLQRVTMNVGGAIRYDVLEGRQHVVVPCVMLTQGVHAGSKGPMFYPADEMSRHPAGWDLRPITVYHPEIDGKGVTAADPTVLNTQKVGVLLNSGWNSKLRTSCWIDVERANAVDTRVLDAVLNNRMMEVSTGLFVDEDPTPGEFGGEKYDTIARNHRPDHLALLPDRVGACSIAKGAGLLQLNEQLDTLGRTVDPKKVEQVRKLVAEMLTANEMSFENIRSGLSSALRNKLGDSWDGWIENVYTSFVIYWNDAKLFLLGYSATDTKVELASDDPEGVVRVTEYRKEKDGTFVGNSLGDTKQTQEEDPNMDRKQQIDALIANAASGWVEGDRQILTSMPEAQFAKLVKNAQPVQQAQTTTTTAPAPGAQCSTSTQPAQNAAPATLSVEQYIANAPGALQQVLRNGVQTYNAQKASVIKNIMSAPGNRFNEAYLNTLELEHLQGMESLIPQPVGNMGQQPFVNGVPMFQQNFAGAALPQYQPVGNMGPEPGEGDILNLPVLDYSKKTG